MGEAEFTSNFKSTLPPGDYTALITLSNGKQESYPFYLPEGDYVIVAVDIDAPVGAVLVYLNDPDANEASANGIVRTIDNVYVNESDETIVEIKFPNMNKR